MAETSPTPQGATGAPLTGDVDVRYLHSSGMIGSGATTDVGAPEPELSCSNL